MQQLDANKIHEEKARWELHKNATSCFEQILEVDPLGMILNCIWWWGSNPGVLENMEYLFIAITSRSTLTRSDSTC